MIYDDDEGEERGVDWKGFWFCFLRGNERLNLMELNDIPESQFRRQEES